MMGDPNAGDACLERSRMKDFAGALTEFLRNAGVKTAKKGYPEY